MSQKILLITSGFLGFLILILIVVVVVSTKRNVTSPTTPPPSGTDQIGANPTHFIKLDTVTKTEGNSSSIEIWLTPKEPTINISTLSMEVAFTSPTGSLSPKASSPTIAAEFKEGGWTFPFANFQTQGNSQVVMKLAALYVSTTPFPLNQKTLFATIPLKTEGAAQVVNVTVNPANSKAYTNTSELIAFE